MTKKTQNPEVGIRTARVNTLVREAIFDTLDRTRPTTKAEMMEAVADLLGAETFPGEELQQTVARVLWDLKARRLVLYKGGKRNQYLRAAAWKSAHDLVPYVEPEQRVHPVAVEA